jgi:dimethylaniline monooxygenase (N-oxide forming)
MFHNKSDDFLDLVACGRIQIVGPPVDGEGKQFANFDTGRPLDLQATLCVPAIGYQANIRTFTDGLVSPSDFYMACCHLSYSTLHLVGFARPIIGNIPSISEMQAYWICNMLAGKTPRPTDMVRRHKLDQRHLQARFSTLNLEGMVPVEMFPYCDQLAKQMGIYPSIGNLGSLRAWIGVQLSPATTMHYLRRSELARKQTKEAPFYLPWPLVLLLCILQPIDWMYRGWLHLRRMAK